MPYYGFSFSLARITTMTPAIRLRLCFAFLFVGQCATFLLQHNKEVISYTKHKLYYSEPNDMNLIIARAPPLLKEEVYEPKPSDLEVEPVYQEINEEYSLASELGVTHVPLVNRKVEVIGHRGSPYTALENTARSFIHAAQAGASGVELDVFVLKCGTLVVFHGSGGDETPGLLLDYCGIPGSILDYTAEDARRLLRFNKHFKEFGCGPHEITHPDDSNNHLAHYCYVHTLEEVLTTLRDHPDVPPDFTIKIELKGPGTAIPAVELVRKLNMQHRSKYSSFDHVRIAEVKMVDPDAITGALFASDVPHDFIERCISVGADEVHFKYDTCSIDRVQAAHKAGLSTMCWFRGPIGMDEDSTFKYLDVGNEDEAMYETVLRSGVSSLCVNKPGVLVKTLERMNRNLPLL